MKTNLKCIILILCISILNSNNYINNITIENNNDMEDVKEVDNSVALEVNNNTDKTENNENNENAIDVSNNKISNNTNDNNSNSGNTIEESSVNIPASVTADINSILVNYNLTEDEFYTLVAIVAAEGGRNYTEAYAVFNTIYNRTISNRWVSYASSFGYDGSNLYSQAILPNQFTVYSSGAYQKYMYRTDIPSYDAVVTLLTTGISIHNFLSFRAGYTGASGTQFVDNGNIYFNEL